VPYPRQKVTNRPGAWRMLSMKWPRQRPSVRHPLQRQKRAPLCRGLSCAEEDSNLHPAIPDQTLNLARRNADPSRSCKSVQIVRGTRECRSGSWAAWASSCRDGARAGGRDIGAPPLQIHSESVKKLQNGLDAEVDREDNRCSVQLMGPRTSPDREGVVRARGRVGGGERRSCLYRVMSRTALGSRAS
jgi:hypothetical protein